VAYRRIVSAVQQLRRAGAWAFEKPERWLGLATLVVLGTTLATLPGPSTAPIVLRSPAVVSAPTTSSSTSTLQAPVPSTTTVPSVPPTTTPTVAPLVPTTTPTAVSASGDCGPPYDPTDGTGVTCAQYLAWSQVAVCEEGGWVGASGSAYPDSLGIDATNWWGNGGTSDVSPDAQIVVALRIQTNPPDQGRCTGSW